MSESFELVYEACCGALGVAFAEVVAAEHYEWSFSWGSFPRAESAKLFRGWTGKTDAAQDLRDSFSRLVEPSRVLSRERLARWVAG
ncbi:MAG: hypothetical protein WBQ21_04965 [Solirubrobacteraceae bacterium]